MIEPTPDNISLYYLSGGFCCKCGKSSEFHITPINERFWYCEKCWRVPNKDMVEWTKLTAAWAEALYGQRRYGK